MASAQSWKWPRTLPGGCLSTATGPLASSQGNYENSVRTSPSCTGGWAHQRKQRLPWQQAPTFSVNASQARSWKSLRLVPADRLLLETDYPFGDRSESPPRRPGNLARSETAVSTALSMSPDALRRRTWSNLKDIAETLNLVEMFSRDFQVQLLAA